MDAFLKNYGRILNIKHTFVLKIKNNEQSLACSPYRR